jgi:hypothetical protein
VVADSALGVGAGGVVVRAEVDELVLLVGEQRQTITRIERPTATIARFLAAPAGDASVALAEEGVGARYAKGRIRWRDRLDRCPPRGMDRCGLPGPHGARRRRRGRSPGHAPAAGGGVTLNEHVKAGPTGRDQCCVDDQPQALSSRDEGRTKGRWIRGLGAAQDRRTRCGERGLFLSIVIQLMTLLESSTGPRRWCGSPSSRSRPFCRP